MKGSSTSPSLSRRSGGRPELESAQYQDLTDFRKWVHQLTWHQLVTALQFTLENDESGKEDDDEAQEVANSGRATFTYSRKDDWQMLPKELQAQLASSQPSTGCASFNNLDVHLHHDHQGKVRREWSLLQDMIHRQVPSPTPIHGRALTHAWASQRAPNSLDPQGEAFRRVQDRIHRPRLFQWVESTTDRTSRTDGLPRPSARSRRPVSALSPKPDDDDSSSPGRRSFQVLARQFFQPSGERYSVPLVWEQAHVDADLVQATAVVVDLTADHHRRHRCLAYHPPASANDDEERKRQRVLRQLWVASRGRFLTQPYGGATGDHHQVQEPSGPKKKKNKDKKNPPGRTEKTHPAYAWAPWFHPTECWFPLAMYLASQYELALYRSYWRQRHFLPGGDDALAPSLLGPFWKKAVVHATRHLLTQARDHLIISPPKSSSLPAGFYLRDELLWHLIETSSSSSSTKPWRCTGGEGPPWLVPLPLYVSSSTEPWVDLIRQAAQELRAQWSEEQLLRDLLGSTADTETANPQFAKRPRKTKKKKSKATPDIMTISAVTPVPGNQWVGEEEKKEKGDSSSGSESDASRGASQGAKSTLSTDIQFPVNDVSVRDRNRNTVMALSLLDDVMEKAFRQMGLPEEPSAVFSEKEEAMLDADFQPQSLATASDPLVTADNNIIPNQEEEESMWPFDSPNLSNPLGTSPANESAIEGGKLDLIGIELHDQSKLSLNVPSHGSGNSGSLQQQHRHFHRVEPHDLEWGFHGDAMDEWERIRGATSTRDQSLLIDFFNSLSKPASEDKIVASSTAASLASSSDQVDSDNDEQETTGIAEIKCIHEENASAIGTDDEPELVEKGVDDVVGHAKTTSDSVDVSQEAQGATPELHRRQSKGGDGAFSPPATPSPTLSPILLSLSDLRDVRNNANLPKGAPTRTRLAPAKSLPASPHAPSRTLQVVAAAPRDHPERKPRVDVAGDGIDTAQWTDVVSSKAIPKIKKSRDDHDIKLTRNKIIARRAAAVPTYRNVAARPSLARDDTDLKQAKTSPPKAADALQTYRNIVARGTLKSTSSVKTISESSKKSLPHILLQDSAVLRDRPQDSCAQSERAVDELEDNAAWHDVRRNHPCDETDNYTSKDGSTTITSVSQRESEDMNAVREERDMFRDMCLTLGAEVAKLKNMMAVQRQLIPSLAVDYTPSRVPHSMIGSMPLDVVSLSHSFHIFPRDRTLGAMSDTGNRGEHESLASEDDFARQIKSDSSRHLTMTGSDLSVEGGAQGTNPQFGAPLSRDPNDTISLGALQSRLTRDIAHFLDKVNDQLIKQGPKRRLAVERMTRLVNTVWPRAQVKLYGSHVCGLCLPSSDLDFVICLPAVHKKDVAVAPGVLEGRNAINETSQKLLARRLKGESWIDPRSLKLIERTAVPVVKVATKDTKAGTIQLDITFDGPGHHGLQAIHVVKQIMDELPMIRPLVLLLKQFLIDRGLLTAYSGGLSSYCLFLMVARYLQEQPSSWGDCGSLLMGFLDFYGNCFDPRSTGISVRRRQYFQRENYAFGRSHSVARPMWSPQFQSGQGPSPFGVQTQFSRRNSFSDKGTIDRLARGATILSREVRFHFDQPHVNHFVPPNVQHQVDQNALDMGQPYTFDPLFVEDPLSEGNNVGRNAFRIFQVQRAFSDAHRALVASLEWDISSSTELQEGNEYPLLKCLLHSQDVVFDL